MLENENLQENLKIRATRNMKRNNVSKSNESLYRKLINYLNKGHSRTIIIFVVALYISIPFNILLLQSYPLATVISYILPIIFMTTIVIWITSFSIILFKIFSTVLILCSSGFWFTHYIAKADVNMNFMMALFYTNKAEITDHISYGFVFYLIVLGILPSIVLWTIKINKITLQIVKLKQGIKQILTLCCVFIIFLISSYFLHPREVIYKKNKYIPAFSFFVPLNVEYNPINFIQPFIKSALLTTGNRTFEDVSKYNFSFNPPKKTDKPLVVVLVIGETARSDHFSLGGYNRQTNPLLSKQKNLVYFNHFTSCNTGTIASVTCLLSHKIGKEFRKKLTYNYQHNIDSVVDVFNAVGFKTYFSTTSSYRKSDPIISRFLHVNQWYYLSANEFFDHRRDELIIGSMKDIISEHDPNNKLVIFHTYGSHYKYNTRYSKQFEKYTPICSITPSTTLNDCTIESIVNEYDNTIIYTDYVLNSLIEALKEENAILIYASDHGESLGEDGNFYHGIDFDKAPKVQTHIPAIIWFSNDYIKNYTDKNKNHALSLINSPINHDYIWHSLVNCAYITSTSNIIDPNMSMCGYTQNN